MVFHRAKIPEPVKPLLLLPDVVDPSAWYEGKHHYDDPENRYIFVFEGTPRSGDITYNTKAVNAAEIKSYWDLLESEMARQNRFGRPVGVGADQCGVYSLDKVLPSWGADFLRRLHAETDISIVRSNEQMMDWLSAGKFAFGIGARDVDPAVIQGLPLRQFPPGSLKEGSSVTAYNGMLSYFNRAPSQRGQGCRRSAALPGGG